MMKCDILISPALASAFLLLMPLAGCGDMPIEDISSPDTLPPAAFPTNTTPPGEDNPSEANPPELNPPETDPPEVDPPVVPPPTSGLVASPATVVIHQPVGVGPVQEQVITLEDASGGSYPWTLELEGGVQEWLAVDRWSGDELPATVTIQPTTLFESSGRRSVTLHFSAEHGAEATVELTYQAEKNLIADPDTTHFEVTYAWETFGWPAEPRTITIYDEFGGSYPWELSNILLPPRPHCTDEPWISVTPTSGDSLPAQITIEALEQPGGGRFNSCLAEFEIFGGRDTLQYQDGGDWWETLRFVVSYSWDYIH